MPVKKYIFPDREAWLEGRKNHIGGSEASACVGMNPYKDNVTLWEEKMGLVIPEDISDKDYVRYGTAAEYHLRELFAMDFPEYRVSLIRIIRGCMPPWTVSLWITRGGMEF